jgi:hypothetical protein
MGYDTVCPWRFILEDNNNYRTLKLSEPLAGLAGLRQEFRTVYPPDTKYEIVSTQS